MAGKTATVLGRWDFREMPFGSCRYVKRLERKKMDTGMAVLRSNLNGMPMAQMLLSMDATVTTCHSKTANVEQHLRNADIVAW